MYVVCCQTLTFPFFPIRGGRLIRGGFRGYRPQHRNIDNIGLKSLSVKGLGCSNIFATFNNIQWGIALPL